MTTARLPLLLAVLLAVAPALADAPYRLLIGDPMPDVELTRLDGSRVATASLRGHRVALTFFSPYCGPCQKEIPVLARGVDRMNGAATDRVRMVVIATDARPDKAAIAKAPNAEWLIDQDDQARAAFDPRTLPCTFLADHAGTVRHINRGFGSGYETRVERWLRSMLAQRSDGGDAP
jgi:cytochrome c biogenesis protein CcmG/thiol:disulfide interchange protein DsbE